MKQTEINTNSIEEKSTKGDWQPAYTWVLVVNAIYIILFYLLMKFL